MVIAWNDIRMELAERSTLFFFLLLPLVFTLVIGLGLQSLYQGGGEPSDPRYPVYVVDEDQSNLATRLKQLLDASKVVRPVHGTADEAAAALEKGDVSAVLTIPAGFQASLLKNEPVELQLKKSPNDTQVFAIEEAIRADGELLGSAVAAAQASLAQAEKLRPVLDDAERQAYFAEAFDLALKQLADPPATERITQAPETTTSIGSSFDQGSAGQLVTWTLITLIGASEVFVNERLLGTLRRLLITPTQKAVILVGKITGRLGLGLIQMAILIGFGMLALHVNWGRSPAALVLVVLSFSLAAVALGVFLGTLARTPSQASGLTVMCSMLFSALGGAWWPLEITPKLYQEVVKVLPTTWAMIGFNNVIVRGQGVEQVLPQVVILLGFAAIFFFLGVWRLRYD
jgi:ABC-2 type transport system permease protein